MIYFSIVLSKSFITIQFIKKNSTIFEDTLYPKLLTQLSFGTPLQSFTMCINTGSPFTWVINGNEITNQSLIINRTVFNPKASSSLSTSNEAILFWEDQLIFGKMHSDTIQLTSSKTIQSIEFILATNFRDLKDCNGILGLQYNKLRFKYNTLLHQLYLKGLIESNQFSIQYFNNINEGRLILGDDNSLHLLPQEERNIYCNVIKDNLIAMWYCRIKGITIYPHQYLISKETIISINPSFGLIIGPGFFKDVINNKILNKHIANGNCNEEFYVYNSIDLNFDDYFYNKRFYSFLCNKQANVSLHDQFKLSFDFGKEMYSTNRLDINEEDMFIDYNSTHKMFTILIDASLYSMKVAPWIIGGHVLQKYKLIFNNDDNVIWFIEANNSLMLSSSEPNANRSTIRFITILSLVCFLLFISLWSIKRTSLIQKRSLLLSDGISTIIM